VEQFKYLETSLNQNSIQEENKSRLKSENDCYQQVQNILSSRLLYKNIKIMMYTTKHLPVFYGCETLSLILREERRLKVFENRVLKRILESKRVEIEGKWRKLNNVELVISTPQNIVRVIKLTRMR